MNHELEKRLLAYMTGIDRIYASKDRDGCCGDRSRPCSRAKEKRLKVIVSG